MYALLRVLCGLETGDIITALICSFFAGPCATVIFIIFLPFFEMIFRKHKSSNKEYEEESITIPDSINEDFLLSVARRTKCIGMSSDDESFKKMKENSE